MSWLYFYMHFVFVSPLLIICISVLSDCSTQIMGSSLKTKTFVFSNAFAFLICLQCICTCILYFCVLTQCISNCISAPPRSRAAVWRPGLPPEQQGHLQPQEARTPSHPVDEASCKSSNPCLVIIVIIVAGGCDPMNIVYFCLCPVAIIDIELLSKECLSSWPSDRILWWWDLHVWVSGSYAAIRAPEPNLEMI